MDVDKKPPEDVEMKDVKDESKEAKPKPKKEKKPKEEKDKDDDDKDDDDDEEKDEKEAKEGEGGESKRRKILFSDWKILFTLSLSFSNYLPIPEEEKLAAKKKAKENSLANLIKFPKDKIVSRRIEILMDLVSNPKESARHEVSRERERERR